MYQVTSDIRRERQDDNAVGVHNFDLYNIEAKMRIVLMDGKVKRLWVGAYNRIYILEILAGNKCQLRWKTERGCAELMMQLLNSLIIIRF